MKNCMFCMHLNTREATQCYNCKSLFPTNKEPKNMPTLSVIAVFVARAGWYQYRFADGSTTDSKMFQGIASFTQMALDLDSAAFSAVQKALLNQDTWVRVE